jgi:hypothetical protein
MDVDEGEREMRIEGGEEMENLQLLLPRADAGGKLFVGESQRIFHDLTPAPHPVQRHFILTPDPLTLEAQDVSMPGFLSAGTTIQGIDTSAPPKRAQPAHLFKFRNHVTGHGPPNKKQRKE